MTRPIHDCVVVGAGPAGLAATIALRQAGFDAICAGPAPDGGKPDRRTTALLQGSVRFLGGLGLWDRLEAASAPLRSLRLIDRTGRLLRAPDTLFEAGEIGEKAFGYNIPNVTLVSVLFGALGPGFLPTAGVTGIEAGEDHVTLSLAEGPQLAGRLVIGADGRQSLCRERAGIGTRGWRYDQTAVVCNFAHGRPHRGACTEFHYANGPFTVVPLPGDRSSLVWVERKAEAARIAAFDDDAMAAAIAVRLGGVLGDVTGVEARGSFPLSGLLAKALTGRRIALVGEAAHVIPPIGAQGLNLGFRDVADLVRVLASHRDDPGAPAALAAYESARRSDVLARTIAADLLNRTLISGLFPLQFMRGLGLMGLSMIPPLKRSAMRRGMAAV